MIFALGMLLSAMSGRTTLLATRGKVSRSLNAANAVRDVVGTVAGLCFWVLIVWGFSALNWYVALPTILVAGIAGGMVVSPATFAFFHRVEPLLDVATLGVTGWLWAAHWPY